MDVAQAAADGNQRRRSPWSTAQLSTAERLGLAGVATFGAAAVWPIVAHATGLGLPCPLRSLTGIPCPLCGMTTASVALTRGHWRESLTANPFAVALATAAVTVVVVMALRLTGRVAPAGAWSNKTMRATQVLVGLAIAGSWLFQLRRFGLLG